VVAVLLLLVAEIENVAVFEDVETLSKSAAAEEEATWNEEGVVKVTSVSDA
jgi:hypothetical protein